MATTSATLSHYQCPECCLGDQEVGEISGDEIYCAVCWENDGKLIQLQRWEEAAPVPHQARFRGALVVVAA
jgi:hypothetical protein